MKKTAIHSILTLILTTSTVLANAPAKDTCPPPCPPPCPVVEPAPCPVPVPPGCPKAFQGFFFGGLIGLGAGNVNQKVAIFNQTGGVTTQAYSIQNRLGVKGIVGGLTLGYTWRMRKLGLGLEGVIDWSNIQGQFIRNYGLPGQDSYSAILYNTYQIRGNISYVIQELVAPKLIVGWELGKWKDKKFLQSCDTRNAAGTARTPFEVKRTKDLNALVLGTGVDFLMTGHITVGLDWTFSFYNKHNTRDAYINTPAAVAQGAPGSVICTVSNKPQVISKIVFTTKYIF